MKLPFRLFIAVLACTLTCSAADDQKAREEMEKIASKLQYQQGEVAISNGLAKFSLSPEYKFLGQNDARTVLEKLWGNPPSTHTLGMLIPANKSPLDMDCWAVIVSYSDEGHVKDDDAGKTDYTKLMKEMQEGTRENNKERVKAGYPPIELIGWAAPPRYDAATHKLYWAKELRFEGSKENTLNYDIRILGRRGHLVLSAISDITQLPEIEKSVPQILSMVNFNEGNRYSDFDPKVDKVATYGIAALVAGGVAAKLGLFKGILVAVLALKKFVIVGFFALMAGAKKLFGKKTA